MQGNNQFFAVFGSGGSSSGGGGVSGSGTLNYVAKWTPDGSTIGDSIIQDNGSELGLNCTPDIGNGVRIEIPTTAIWSNALFTYHPDGRSGSNYNTIHSLSRNSNSGNTQEVAILGQVIPTTFQNSVQYVGLKGLLGNNNTNDHLGEHCGILGSSDQSGKDVKGVVGTIANGKSAIGVYGYLIDDATHSVDNFTGVQGTANIDNTSVSGSAYGVVGSVTIADVTNLPTQNAGGSFGATMSANADAGTYTMTALQSTGVRTTAFAGVLETAYSLKVGANNDSIGTITNKYGIYQEGADDLNFFNANTGIGVNPLNSEAILTVRDTRSSNLPAIFGFNSTQSYAQGVQGAVGNNVDNTSIDLGTEGLIGVFGNVNSSNSLGTDYGVYGYVVSSSNNHLDLYGVAGRVYYTGTTTTRDITGGEFQSNVNGASAQVLNCFGIDVDSYTSNTATIGGHYGIRVQLRSNSGTPSITNAYGVYVDVSNINYGSGVTNLYGIRQIGSSALNELQGNLTSEGQIWSQQPASAITITLNNATFDCDNGNGQVLNLNSATNNVTLTFTNMKAGGTYFLKVIQNAITPYNIATYSVSGGNILFPSGTAPTISTGASAIDTIVFYYDGTNLLANFSQDYQ